MNQLSDWNAAFSTGASEAMQTIINYLPNLGGAVIVLLTGWLVAWLLQTMTRRVVSGLGQLPSLFGGAFSSGKEPSSQSVARISGQLVFWLVILLFATVAVNLLGLAMFSGWLDQLVQYLPNVISGALIILGGIIAGRLVRDMVYAAGGAIADQQRVILARAAQYFITAALLLIGVGQLGIDISAIVILLAVASGVALGGLAIAFGLGAQRLVSNLIGIRYLGAEYEVGQRLRIGELEGTIVDVTAVAVVLDTMQGRTTIPAYMLADEPSTLVSGTDRNV